MKTRLENTIDPLGQDPTKDKTESSRWEPSQQKILLPVDRPVDRQRSDFPPLEKRSTGRSTVVPKHRVKLSVGRPGRSIGTNREHCSCSRSIGPVDRRARLHLVHVGRPPGQSTEQFCSASGLPAEGQNLVFGNPFEVIIFPTIFAFDR